MSGSPSKICGSGREVLQVCPRVVGRPSHMFVSGRKAISDVREWSGGPPRCS